MFDYDVGKLVLPNRRTVEQELQHEAERLKKLIQVEIDRWYSSYSPVVYPRSNRMKNCLYVDDACTITANSLTISVRFSEDAFHKSLWSNTKVNVLLLQNYGYQVKSGWHKNIPFFGYRSPARYLEEAIETFNKSSKLGFKAKLNMKASLYQ